MKNIKANQTENKLVQLINKAQQHELVIRFDFVGNQLSVWQSVAKGVVGAYDKIYSTPLTDMDCAIIRTHEFIQSYTRRNYALGQ